MKPAIEMAAVTPGSAIPFDPADRRPVLAVDRVVVVDQEARRGSCRGGLADLLLHPGERRGGRDVRVDDAPRGDLHDDEDIGDGERGGVLAEEVAGPQFPRVVANERPPGLATAWWVAPPPHVGADRAPRVGDAELCGEFLGDLVLAPLGVVGRDAADEGDVAAGNPRSAGPGLPVPQGREALPVPADHRGGFHEDEVAGSVGPHPA